MRGQNRLESSSIKYRISTNQMNQQSNRKEVENIMRKIMSAVRNHAKKASSAGFTSSDPVVMVMVLHMICDCGPSFHVFNFVCTQVRPQHSSFPKVWYPSSSKYGSPVSPNLSCLTGRWDFMVRTPLSSRHFLSFLSQLHFSDSSSAHDPVKPHAQPPVDKFAPPQYVIFWPSREIHHENLPNLAWKHSYLMNC